MPSYKIIFHKNAQKFIKKNKEIGLKFFKAFAELSENKENTVKYQIKKIEGVKVEHVYRLKINEYRAIFRVLEEEILIFVFTIDSRGDVYKSLKNIKK